MSDGASVIAKCMMAVQSHPVESCLGPGLQQWKPFVLAAVSRGILMRVQGPPVEFYSGCKMLVLLEKLHMLKFVRAALSLSGISAGVWNLVWKAGWGIFGRRFLQVFWLGPTIIL